jgi:S-methylmethionine-dependent homocysteine/selenocysteine methylase
LNRANPESTPQAVQSFPSRPILLDGALGTELEKRGASLPLPSWTTRALLDTPDLVRQVHQDYVEAGAQVITAATFRTSRYSLSKVGMEARVRELTQLALTLARSAVENVGTRHVVSVPIRIACSLAPLEDCFDTDKTPSDLVLQAEHRHTATLFAELGADIILVETQGSLREARIATRAARNAGVPVWTSFVLKDPDRLISGDSLKDAAKAAVDNGAEAILINCTPKNIASQAVVNLSSQLSPIIAIGCYPNAYDTPLTPSEFADWAMRIRAVCDILGGCCGIGPEHIKEFRTRLIT